MQMFEVMEFDRIEKIKQINNLYNLENNAYLSFSGGKDSTVLHYLLDLALPNNKIPRVYLNTGIEYKNIRLYVEEMAKNDNRIIIINSNVNFKKMFKTHGYPFKSKEHSEKIGLFQNGSKCKSVTDYIDILIKGRYQCPEVLKEQLNLNYPLKISNKCCYFLKKRPARNWAKANNKTIVLTGERIEEGGLRANHSDCLVFDKKDNLIKFKVLNPLSNKFNDCFIEKYNIRLCKLYYPPYNFRRTGCKGCPFSLKLQEQLTVMKFYLRNEYKQCEILWGEVYKEYRRLNYRLDKEMPNFIKTTIFNFIEERKRG